MGLVNIEELEKQAKEKEEAKNEILTKIIGEKKYFSHKLLKSDEWYDRLDEALSSAQAIKVREEYKAQGLNENGQTPEQVEKGKRRAEKIKVRENLLRQLAAVDEDIQAVNQKKEERKK